jgi:hypothetical protein
MVLVYHPMFVTNLLSAMPTNYNLNFTDPLHKIRRMTVAYWLGLCYNNSDS